MREGWEIVPFGDVCEISGGSQPPKDNFIYEPKDGYVRLVQVRDYRTDKYITYIPKEKARKFCSKTDIMIGRYGPPIFGIFSGIEGAYNVALMKAIPDETKIDKTYLRWFLKTDALVKFVEKTSKRAAGQDGVRKERLYAYPTPIPSLIEQKQIVELLDQAFAAIDQAKANIEKNIQNAKELFQSKFNEIFSQKGEGWEIVPFGDVCEISGGSQPPKDNFIYEPKDGYVRLVQVRDYRTDKYITYIPKEKARKFCSKTDIMIGRYGPPIFGIFSGIEGAYNVALMKAIPDETKIDKTYLRWFLKTDALVKFVEKTSKRAAGQDGVRKERLYAYPTPIPSLIEQKQIVELSDSLTNKTTELVKIYESKLSDLEEFKKSILQKAFTGELTEKSVLA